MTDSREDTVTEETSVTEETFVTRDLETVKCMTWNVKLNQANEEVPALVGSGSEVNLISRAYATQLPVKIMDISSSLATINKQ